MRKIYTFVALGLLFAACGSEEMVNEKNLKQNTVNTVSSVGWVNLIDDIEATCTQSNHVNMSELIRYVEDKAFANTAFRAFANQGYTSPTAIEVSGILQHDIAAQLNQMSYSPVLKGYLHQLWVMNSPLNAEVVFDNRLSTSERELLQVSLDHGHDPDGWNKGTRPYAIAYGYQQSKAKAVIMAVLVGQVDKIN